MTLNNETNQENTRLPDDTYYLAKSEDDSLRVGPLVILGDRVFVWTMHPMGYWGADFVEYTYEEILGIASRIKPLNVVFPDGKECEEFREEAQRLFRSYQ